MINPDIRRKQLFDFFERYTIKTLSFLENLGYNLCVTNCGHIIWSSTTNNIAIFYERIGFEIYMTFSSVNDGYVYTIDEIISCIQGGTDRRFRFATNEVEIKNSINELSMLLQKPLYGLIVEDTVAIAEVTQSVINNRNHLVLEAKLKEIKKKAKAAWDKKDYHSVVKEYSSILEHLTPAEKLRLDLCKKHL